MQNEQEVKADPVTAVFYTIDLNEGRGWSDCAMCGEYRRLDHAVGWCCGPTHDEIGSPSSDYRGATVNGMCVCKPCHDGFYSTATQEPVK